MTSLPGHFQSQTLCDVISCDVTASSCELQSCRKSNAHYMPGFGLLQPLPGEFRSNDATSGSLPVNWGHVTSFSVTWLPPPATYRLVGSQTLGMPVFGLLQPLPGDFRSNDVTSGSLPVTWGHVKSFSITWLPPPARYSLVEVKRTVYTSFGLLQPLPRAVATGTASTAMAVPPFICFLLFFTSTTILLTYHGSS